MHKKLYKKIKDKIEHHFEEVLKIKTSPESLALGFSIGTFIGVLPLPFINIFIALLVLFIFKKVSKITLFFSIFFWNPIIQLPLTILSFKVGDIIFGNSIIIKYELVILNQVLNVTRRYMVGNLIVAFTTSIFVYFVAFYLIKKFKK